MTHMEDCKVLRATVEPHYNCCQSILVPFAAELGMTREQAYALGFNFGSGIRHGSACGALTGALMVLGALGYDEHTAAGLIRDFKANHGATDCATLLKASHDRGEVKKAHCDGLVFEMLEFLDKLLAEKE